ncbi:unnamed protein product [Ostreobium quekettii]|uniref:Uncharacterized protein n=1 Tax=Ostreobium quekettii TaxID=121088 RepID=A0A8S1IQN4_9CHLO|nr:unnamed protein product [Ostreobium quekettii]
MCQQPQTLCCCWLQGNIALDFCAHCLCHCFALQHDFIEVKCWRESQAGPATLPIMPTNLPPQQSVGHPAGMVPYQVPVQGLPSGGLLAPQDSAHSQTPNSGPQVRQSTIENRFSRLTDALPTHSVELSRQQLPPGARSGDSATSQGRQEKIDGVIMNAEAIDAMRNELVDDLDGGETSHAVPSSADPPGPSSADPPGPSSTDPPGLFSTDPQGPSSTHPPGPSPRPVVVPPPMPQLQPFPPTYQHQTGMQEPVSGSDSERALLSGRGNMVQVGTLAGPPMHVSVGSAAGIQVNQLHTTTPRGQEYGQIPRAIPPEYPGSGHFASQTSSGHYSGAGSGHFYQGMGR